MSSPSFGTILFSDLVSYSEQPAINQQILVKNFSDAVQKFLNKFPESEIKALPSGGDSIILVFFHHSNQLWNADTILKLIIKLHTWAFDSGTSLRIGLHVGKIDSVTVVDNSSTLIGDAINCTKRIMDASKPKGTLVSDTFLREYFGNRKFIKEIDLSTHEHITDIFKFSCKSSKSIRVKHNRWIPVHKLKIEGGSKDWFEHDSRAKIIISLFLVFILFAASMGFWMIQKTGTGFSVSTDFKNSSLQKLRNEGWQVLHINKEYFDRSLTNKKGLTLYTLPGDYWTMDWDSMERYIDNVWYLPVPAKNFKIEVSISDFQATCPHQQAGIILLQDTIELAYNIRYTTQNKPMPDSSIHVSFQAVFSKPKDGKNRWGQSFNDPQEKISFVTGNPLNFKGRHGAEKICLEVIKYNENYIFRRKTEGSDRPYDLSFVYKFPLQPKFICLAAFQGFFNGRDKDIICENIPALFSDFKLSSISQEDEIEINQLIMPEYMPK